jgi:thiol-disulfide isomerase/thioredoxin
MTRPRLVFAIAVCVSTAIPLFVQAQQPEGPKRASARLILPPAAKGGDQPAASDAEGEKQIDPAAKKVIDAFANYVHDLKAFSVEAVSNIKTEALGQKVDMTMTQQIRVERPNKLYLSMESSQPLSGAKVVSDGKEMLVYLAPFKKYTIDKAPQELSDLLQNPLLMGLTSGGNAGVITAAIFSDNPAEKMLENIEALEYVGTETLGDAKVHHLKAKSTQFDWELYVDAGDKPLPRKFVPDLSKLLEQMAKANPRAAQQQMKIENVITFEKWDTAPKFDDQSFALATPEGADKVNSILEMFGQPGQSESAEKLVGQDAPALELETLDGGGFKLADQKNKYVVILDFWATWCGPCRRAMPIISKVAKEYEDKGVVFYAVNIKEDADTIKQFLKDEELDVPVALDSDGAVAQKYLANAIPQTVLVGKDGRVQVVHVGLLPDLEKRLSTELEALVQGKDLAAQASPPTEDQDKSSQ